ncbi:hypothetical protein E2C01_023010 [Portunus trituberculatus]|uniref:Uncharacterized protein n=1 Tax=Portunus trituberculatus TaxID=210409 RepID=A0A5B7E6X6_PORTR|nr:hypothetical protein [Portunus trituberculatus]
MLYLYTTHQHGKKGGVEGGGRKEIKAGQVNSGSQEIKGSRRVFKVEEEEEEEEVKGVGWDWRPIGDWEPSVNLALHPSVCCQPVTFLYDRGAAGIVIRTQDLKIEAASPRDEPAYQGYWGLFPLLRRLVTLLASLASSSIAHSTPVLSARAEQMINCKSYTYGELTSFSALITISSGVEAVVVEQKRYEGLNLLQIGNMATQNFNFLAADSKDGRSRCDGENRAAKTEVQHNILEGSPRLPFKGLDSAPNVFSPKKCPWSNHTSMQNVKIHNYKEVILKKKNQIS